jgi:hypothetical protein
MPKYRIETNERRWVRCTYEIAADDIPSAIGDQENGTEPISITYGDGEFESEDVQFLSITLIDDDPRATPAQEHAAIQSRMGRTKPPTPTDNPEPKG